MKIFALLLLSFVSWGAFAQQPVDYTFFVDPMIGTGGHGHTYPGATVPFGMVQLSPDTYNNEWDWCAGYHAADSSIMGFSHTHLSGTGCADLGDVLLMPTIGHLQLLPGTRENPDLGYRSRFSHTDEKASPGYYSVLLRDGNIQVELSTTPHAGIHKYTFPAADSAHIIIDLHHGISTRSVMDAEAHFINDSTLVGYRASSGWAPIRYVYYIIRFSRSFPEHGLSGGSRPMPGLNVLKGSDVKAYITFAPKKNEVVLVKVGISTVSIANATANLDKEIPDWAFDHVVQQAHDAWNALLAKIDIQTPFATDRKIFYSALYHTLVCPNQIADVDGRYTGIDHKVHTAATGQYYSTLSLWDTYRAAHPLYTLIVPERVPGLVQGMLEHFDGQGYLPVWPLWGDETHCMIGNHAVPVIVEAYLKGFTMDADHAYAAVRQSVMADHNDYNATDYDKYGHVPTAGYSQSVSRTLEYGYDDWCVAQMARALGKTEDYTFFSKRAIRYRNLFDPATHFMRGKTKDGKWYPKFAPLHGDFDCYTEANAWQYLWYVPQDVEGLIQLFGGRKPFISKLDSLFIIPSVLDKTKDDIEDISGLIGQYAHGNEPSHQIAYLYDYAGQPWKTQARVRNILATQYRAGADGYSGNEDCGQMSAWYIFSALGFYPVNPAEGVYEFGSPIFTQATIHLAGGKDVVVTTLNASPTNVYIKGVKLNNKPYNKTYIRYSDLTAGAHLVFEMTDKPNLNWGTGPDAVPPSITGSSLPGPVH